MRPSILIWIAHTRQRLGYAASWAGMLGTPILVVDLAQRKLSGLGYELSFFLLTFLTILGLIIFGYLCEWIGLIQEEQTWAYNMQEKMRSDINKKPETKDKEVN